MDELEDLEALVRVVGEAQSLLKGHLELSADPTTTIAGVHDLLNSPDLIQAIERTRLRVLAKKLTLT